MPSLQTKSLYNEILIAENVPKALVRASQIFLCLVVLLAVFGPWLWPFSSGESKIENLLLSPHWPHIMGTDSLGRDLFARILVGARISLFVGIASTFISLTIGIGFGWMCAWFGGKVDSFIMRALDVYSSLPNIVVVILMSLILDKVFINFNFVERSLVVVLLSIALTSWVSTARLSRTLFLRTRSLPYVEASQALGGTSGHLFRYHIWPACRDVLWLYVGVQLPHNILYESFLSFLGIGLQPPLASWGTLVLEGWQANMSYPYLLWGPGIFLFLTLVSLNVLTETRRKDL